jgi:hypothetical protein
MTKLQMAQVVIGTTDAKLPGVRMFAWILFRRIG